MFPINCAKARNCYLRERISFDFAQETMYTIMKFLQDLVTNFKWSSVVCSFILYSTFMPIFLISLLFLYQRKYMCVCHLSVFFVGFFFTCRIHQKNTRWKGKERTLSRAVMWSCIFSLGVDESKIKGKRGEESDFWALHRHEILRLQRTLVGGVYDYYLWLLFRTGKQRQQQHRRRMSIVFIYEHSRQVTTAPFSFEKPFFLLLFISIFTHV